MEERGAERGNMGKKEESKQETWKDRRKMNIWRGCEKEVNIGGKEEYMSEENIKKMEFLRERE